MNEMILNHIKGYYHGVKDFKCPLLRGELGNKINTFKQRMKKSKNHSKKNYLEQNISDDDIDDDNSFKSKRKRNDDEDEEKENDQYHRKVIIKSTAIKNEQRMIIIKNLFDKSDVTQQEMIENNFDHDYCDIMYDNEFEGLYLSHFSSYDIDPTEEIESNITPIPCEQTADHTSDIDMKPSKDSLLVPLTTSNKEEGKTSEPSESYLFILYFLRLFVHRLHRTFIR
jgi:hypothetical protein